MAFSFGIGDFIAITKLLHEIYTNLRAVPGLKGEVQALIAHYTDLFSSMQTALLVYERDDLSMDSATENCLKLHLQRCRLHLEEFHDQTFTITKDWTSLTLVRKVKYAGYSIKTISDRRAAFKKLNEMFRRDMEAFMLCLDALAR